MPWLSFSDFPLFCCVALIKFVFIYAWLFLNVIFGFQKSEVCSDWEQYLGMEHTDNNAPKCPNSSILVCTFVKLYYFIEIYA